MPESETRRRNSGAGVTEPVEEKLRTAARASSQQLTNPERYRKEAKDWWRLPEAQCFAMFGDGLKRMFWTLPSEVPLTRMGIPVEYGETQSNTHPTTATTAGNVALK